MIQEPEAANVELSRNHSFYRAFLTASAKPLRFAFRALQFVPRSLCRGFSDGQGCERFADKAFEVMKGRERPCSEVTVIHSGIAARCGERISEFRSRLR